MLWLHDLYQRKGNTFMLLKLQCVRTLCAHLPCPQGLPAWSEGHISGAAAAQPWKEVFEEQPREASTRHVFPLPGALCPSCAADMPMPGDICACCWSSHTDLSFWLDFGPTPSLWACLVTAGLWLTQAAVTRPALLSWLGHHNGSLLGRALPQWRGDTLCSSSPRLAHQPTPGTQLCSCFL